MQRRKFMALCAAGCTAMGSARVSWAAPAPAPINRRLVFILQRGAADGLGTIAPVGDPDYVRLRGALAQDYSNAPRLNDMFALHPAMERSAQLYAKGQMLPIHAVASAYRERSHFDGQNLLEIGAERPYARADGWLNRMLGLLDGDPAGLAISPVLPPALQGPSRATSYAPSRLPDPTDRFLSTIDTLYQSDETLHALWQESVRTRALTDGLEDSDGRNAQAVGKLAASLLSAEDGARVAMIETTGWDTHSGQSGRLSRALGSLDTLIASLQDNLGPLWSDTLVIVATEFGRTAAANGTSGTDHGTGSAAMLYGGTVRGGRVVADWPGLRQSDLYEARDLMPTTSLEATISSAVSGHFALDHEQVGQALFPHKTLPGPVGLIG